MLTPFIIPLALIVVAFVCYLSYELLANPFGPNSRCRETGHISFQDGSKIQFVRPDGNMDLVLIQSFVKGYSRTIAGRESAIRILTERWKKTCKRFGADTRIIFREDDGTIWALDILNDKSSMWPCSFDERFTYRLSKIETQSSYEDCLIAIRTVAMDRAPVLTKAAA